ncbi:rod shape-determining protein [Streptomyces chilikensis]|uniref:Rod shape-determining protein n=1 Tax=Streptomyces chilikensis TaxID=1194079 RepID=A0ABV3EZR4_9ACTN
MESGGPFRRRSGAPHPASWGVALDLGSARTRVRVGGRGPVLDVPTVGLPGAARYPVRRGVIVDADGCAGMLGRLLEHRLPRTARPLVVLTAPVLDLPAYRAAARSVVEVLRPRSVLTVPGARAIAVAAGADLSRPLLVVDVGAHLTEVVLLDDGAVTDAHRVALGTGDPGAAPGGIVDAVTRMVAATLRQDDASLMPAALARGVLLAGGGALRPEITYRLTGRLHAPVHVVPAPHTAAVRGAARLLDSARLHPSTRGPGALDASGMLDASGARSRASPQRPRPAAGPPPQAPAPARPRTTGPANMA